MAKITVTFEATDVTDLMDTLIGLNWLDPRHLATAEMSIEPVADPEKQHDADTLEDEDWDAKYGGMSGKANGTGQADMETLQTPGAVSAAAKKKGGRPPAKNKSKEPAKNPQTDELPGTEPEPEPVSDDDKPPFQDLVAAIIEAHRTSQPATVRAAAPQLKSTLGFDKPLKELPETPEHHTALWNFVKQQGIKIGI